MIETRLLHQFIAVAEELHFLRAAQRLHMAQPPLSQAIRRLEAAVGAPLFARTNRSVALTPAGQAFLTSARAVLAALDDGVAHARRVAQGLAGHLTLTFINIAPYGELLRALRRFRAGYPAIAFSLQEATTQEQVDALLQGRADLGFLRPPGVRAPGLRLEPVLREPIVTALPGTHRLADQASIDLAALADEAFVASPRHLGPGFHDQLVQLCEAAGFTPRVAQQARQLQTLVGLVAGGFGVALLPASLAHEGRTDVVFRPLQVEAPAALRHIDLCMAWCPERGSAIRDRLIEEVRQALTPLAAIDTL